MMIKIQRLGLFEKDIFKFKLRKIMNSAIDIYIPNDINIDVKKL